MLKVTLFAENKSQPQAIEDQSGDCLRFGKILYSGQEQTKYRVILFAPDGPRCFSLGNISKMRKLNFISDSI